MAKCRILIIDDEKDLLDLIGYTLQKEGFTANVAFDGETGLASALKEVPDLVIVDLMLPGIDGLEVCRRLRANNRTCHIPIIMLTAKTAETDRIVGLELGADDYVTKPFSPRELAARIKAVLRRTLPAIAPSVIHHGDLAIDINSREARCEGEALDLTASEFRLLHFLAMNPGRALSRAELIDGALGKEVSVIDRTIDVHIASIRKKMGDCGKFIQTVRGFGYRFKS